MPKNVVSKSGSLLLSPETSVPSSSVNSVPDAVHGLRLQLDLTKAQLQRQLSVHQTVENGTRTMQALSDLYREHYKDQREMNEQILTSQERCASLIDEVIESFMTLTPPEISFDTISWVVVKLTAARSHL